jgi:hypothetical protein
MMTHEKLQEVLNPYLKDDSVKFCKTACDKFLINTKQHITRVNTIASFVGTSHYYPYHDNDKFDSPFYCLVPYQSKNKSRNQYKLDDLTLEDVAKNDESVDELDGLIGQATWKHILSKPHHPECWDKSLSLDMKFDRANPRGNIDATKMTMDAMTEYVCDCMSMSIQIDKDPKAIFQWFDKYISTGKGVRWIMTKEQIDFIYSLADSIIKKLQDKTRKVYFDVDGVLRDIVGYFGTPDDDWGVKVDGKTIYEKITEDFSCLEKMPAMDFLKTVKKFTDTPNIISTQIEDEAREYTKKWLLKYFKGANMIFVGEGSSKEKDVILKANDRIFDDHPKFPSSNKLIIVGHGYNAEKHGLRVNDTHEMEAALEVLKEW